MKTTKKPWSEKLRPEMQPAVVDDPKTGGRLLLPTPALVAEELAAIPPGELLTLPELRARLAARFQADAACPLMTGIFLNLLAGAAEEQLAAGRAPLAPYWRAVPANRTLNPKSPPGPARQAEHLRREGHRVEERAGKWRVMT